MRPPPAAPPGSGEGRGPAASQGHNEGSVLQTPGGPLLRSMQCLSNSSSALRSAIVRTAHSQLSHRPLSAFPRTGNVLLAAAAPRRHARPARHRRRRVRHVLVVQHRVPEQRQYYSQAQLRSRAPRCAVGGAQAPVLLYGSTCWRSLRHIVSCPSLLFVADSMSASIQHLHHDTCKQAALAPQPQNSMRARTTHRQRERVQPVHRRRLPPLVALQAVLQQRQAGPLAQGHLGAGGQGAALGEGRGDVGWGGVRGWCARTVNTTSRSLQGASYCARRDRGIRQATATGGP